MQRFSGLSLLRRGLAGPRGWHTQWAHVSEGPAGSDDATLLRPVAAAAWSRRPARLAAPVAPRRPQARLRRAHRRRRWAWARHGLLPGERARGPPYRRAGG